MIPLFEVKQLTKKHWDAQVKRELFSDINTTIDRPERIALLGKSGQGKSTLLRILAKLDSVDSGEVYFNGQLMNDVDSRTWRMNICYVAQQAIMLPGTIKDNLMTSSKIHNRPFEEDFARQLIKEVGLDELDWEKQAGDLSGGEKQRIALVRSLLLQPKILLLDEITASLDQQSKEVVEQLLIKLHQKEEIAFIWVTHDTEQAKNISERIWYMEDGKLASDLKTSEFFGDQASFPTQVIL
ncbi:ATP-binding cassette domain-containing protein [Psychrobacillus sp. FSL K6-2836]|uniref:ABC transporter ATP-binding protein n=1 Tax=Psychrobacillus sp. FSL K6-2836 TaxID=2921548 RepID=UPI0030FA025E